MPEGLQHMPGWEQMPQTAQDNATGLAADGNAAPGLELLMDRLKTFKSNSEFLSEIAKQPGM